MCPMQRLRSAFAEADLSLCCGALDKREYFNDNFSYFSSKPYVVTPHLNRLVEMVQMRVTTYVFLLN